MISIFKYLLPLLLLLSTVPHRNVGSEDVHEFIETIREKVRKLEATGQITRDYEPYVQSEFADEGTRGLRMFTDETLICHFRRNVRFRHSGSGFGGIGSHPSIIGDRRLEDFSTGGRKRTGYNHRHPRMVDVSPSHPAKLEILHGNRRRRSYG